MRFSDLLPTSIHQKTMIALERATLEDKSTMGQITYSVAAVVTGVFSAFEKTLEVPLRVLPTLTASIIRLKKAEFYPSLTVTNLFKTAEAVFHQGRGVLLTLISPLFGCTMNFEAQRTMGNYSSPRKSASEIHAAAQEALKKAGESATKVEEAKTTADAAKTAAAAAQTSATSAETAANDMAVEIETFRKEVEDVGTRSSRAFDNASDASVAAATANTEAAAAKAEAAAAKALVAEQAEVIAELKKEMEALQAIPQGPAAIKKAVKDGFDYGSEKTIDCLKFTWSILTNAYQNCSAKKEKIAKTEACKKVMEKAGYTRGETVVEAQVVKLGYDGTVVQPQSQPEKEAVDPIIADIDPIVFSESISETVTFENISNSVSFIAGKVAEFTQKSGMDKYSLSALALSYFAYDYFTSETQPAAQPTGMSNTVII